MDVKNDYDKQHENLSDIEKMRHSASHVLAMAVLRKFPEAKLGIGPAIEDGFYYDFDLPRQLTQEDLAKIEKEMKQIIKDEIPIQQVVLPREEAIDALNQRGQLYKTELLAEIPDGEISFFKTGDEFSDLCRGPHIENTGKIGAIKLMSIAGAYWRGDEKRPQLQRIYGIAFKTKRELKEHLEKIEEMKQRDHRKLGKELELFELDEETGQGLPLWLPKGAKIRKLIEDFEYSEQEKRGYQHVYTPHIANIKIYKKSGHWDHYQDDMYSPIEIDKEQYILKPMNCPHHIKIYQTKKRSYRELPYRIAEFATVYRYEKSGELTGLSRVRGFTQDDGHIFCTQEQIKEEVKGTLDLIRTILKAIGFDNYRLNLSIRDPENSKKYIDKPKLWNKSETALREVLEEEKLPFTVEIGDAAFYGPKIDFMIKDAFGREEQCGTTQLDFNLPEKFKLTYTGEDGEDHTPVMIHRAPIGSFERIFSRLIEHHGGAFPLWLSPVQIMIIPITDKQVVYAELVKSKLESHGLRVSIDDRQEKMQAKIRDSQVEKIPYMIIVGEKEKNSKTVSVRPYGEVDLGMMKIEEFIDRACEEIENKK